MVIVDLCLPSHYHSSTFQTFLFDGFTTPFKNSSGENGLQDKFSALCWAGLIVDEGVHVFHGGSEIELSDESGSVGKTELDGRLRARRVDVGLCLSGF